ncbi:MAG: 1-acyl-sn-glycerol-3-phosphate acyltransferase [Clostridia bacterium]|nr:1-acyl-sn-glycerol-3-phosphate acyltransferase [Clostridia bacterium]
MNNKKKKGPERWLKPRHAVVKKILVFVLGIYSALRYRIRVKPLGEKNERQYLILFNHQTAFDQFFVGLVFKRPVYYLASEDLFSNGFVSRLIRYLVNPIPIKKQTTDPRAVINCIRVAREGGTIALAPEGNRTFSGQTVNIKPSIAQLAKHLRLPIAFVRIEGGYGVHPRWSDVIRGGGMSAGVSKIIEPDVFSAMSDKELYELICKELWVDEATAYCEHPHKKQAEFLERAIYYCPECKLSRFESHGDLISCQKCGLTVRHLPSKELVGVNGAFPYRFVAEWYNAQNDYVNSLYPAKLDDGVLMEDEVTLSRVILYKKKEKISARATARLYRDRITISETDEEIAVYPFDKVSCGAVLGRNKLNIYIDGEVYQIKGGKRLCALKYLNLLYRYKNVQKGNEDAKFLGL